ncbi:MAG TPA: GspH/FimT family pseudopilin [Gemmatimonadaceae bacterium]
MRACLTSHSSRSSPCREPRRRRAPRGHAALEIVVVLALVGVMTAVVAPALARREEPGGAPRAARALADAMTRARATALARGTTVVLVLDTGNGRLWRASGGEGWTDAGSIASGSDIRIGASSPRARIEFTPTGAAFGDEVEIHDGARRLRLSADSWTGATRVTTR